MSEKRGVGMVDGRVRSGRAVMMAVSLIDTFDRLSAPMSASGMC